MITSTYAALLALFYVYLCFRVISFRRQFKVSLGTGNEPLLLRATRVQANFAEYVPFALLIIFLVEARGASPLLVHALAALLTIGRLSHAFGVSQVNENFIFRVSGMMITFGVFIASSVYLLVRSFP